MYNIKHQFSNTFQTSFKYLNIYFENSVEIYTICDLNVFMDFQKYLNIYINAWIKENIENTSMVNKTAI